MLLGCLFVLTWTPAPCSQGQASKNEPSTRAVESASSPPALTDEAREAIESIRLALADDDRDGARELLREIVSGLAEPDPGEDTSRLAFLLELDRLAEQLGSLEELERVREGALAIRAHLLPPDHVELIKAKGSLAVTKAMLGDLAGARQLQEAVLEAFTRLRPPDDADLLKSKCNLAATLGTLGDLTGARQLLEEVLEAQTRLLSRDDRSLLVTKNNLAAMRYMLGDLAGARQLEEEVLESRTRLLRPDDTDLLVSKLNVAGTRKDLGDLPGARELEEAVLDVWTRSLPHDHPYLLMAMQNLASTRHSLGDYAGAHELFAAVLGARQRLLPPDNPDLLAAKSNLAATLFSLGDFPGALELEEDVLEARARLLPDGHVDLLSIQYNLAGTKYALGQFADARERLEAILDHPERLLSLPLDKLRGVKMNLAETKLALGDLAGTRETVASLLGDMRSRATALLMEASRPAREGAKIGVQWLSEALFLSGSADPEGTLDKELFATLEGLRLASMSSADVAHRIATHSELAEGLVGIAAVRSRLNDLATAGPEDKDSAEGWRRELLRLTEERDRAERALRLKLGQAGAFVGEVDVDAVGARLASGAAAASFLRYTKHFEKDAATGKTPAGMDSMLAFVVRPGGSVTRIDLGATAEVEALVRDWREALGRPLDGRGIGGAAAASQTEALETMGLRLREKVLDPIVARVGEARTLHVVLDDVLHLVPLDALPLAKGLVGERIAIRNEVTLARLLRPRTELDEQGAFVLAGGIDYDAELGAEAQLHLEVSTPPVESGKTRSGATGFVPLPGTKVETEEIGGLYHDVFAREASILTQGGATKAALFAAAPTARFLHLATHGWFASEAFKSQLDSPAGRDSRDDLLRAERTLTGFAPETLCGLALAGANRGKDSLGRVRGILTAEELATFDLRKCELAVLSACETNVGIRRAGQGIQSLQTALHAAGARTAITSLWKVDDDATRRLFEIFYEKLWNEKLAKSEALWQAKMALRAEGHPPRDWAGWVLSGEPD